MSDKSKQTETKAVATPEAAKPEAATPAAIVLDAERADTVLSGEFSDKTSLMYAMGTVARRGGPATDVVKLMAAQGVIISPAAVNSRWKGIREKAAKEGTRIPNLKVGKRGRQAVAGADLVAGFGSFFDPPADEDEDGETEE